MLKSGRYLKLFGIMFAAFFCVCSDGAETETSIHEESVESGVSPSVTENRLADLATTVTKDNLSEYDFTEKASEYLSIIGEKYPDRSMEPGNVHKEFEEWLMAELIACGYDQSQLEEQSFSGEGWFTDHVEGRNIILTVPGQLPG